VSDWRCECGDLNRAHESFCYRCGAGQPESTVRRWLYEYQAVWFPPLFFVVSLVVLAIDGHWL
jgi:hypothetical protein